MGLFVVQNRELHDLHEHWKNEKHQMIEIRYRLVNGLRDLNKACKPAGTAECARQKVVEVGPTHMSMDLMAVLSVGEVIAGETADEVAATSSTVVFKMAGDNLRICPFPDNFVLLSQVDRVVSFLNNLSATLSTEPGF